jgi:hypothetical protein
VLDVEGAASADEINALTAKVNEFRENNVRLMKDAERFKDIDPARYQQLVAQADELGKKGVKGSADIEAAIKTAVDAAIAPLKTELETSSKARQAAQEKADAATMRTQIGDKALKLGLKPGAMDYILLQAGQKFAVVDGAVKAKDNVFSAKNPGNALDVDEWLGSAVKEHDFAFESSRGGGAQGNTNIPGAKEGGYKPRFQTSVANE